MKKKLLGIFFALVLCALVFPAAGMAETKSVDYIDEKGNKQTCDSATVVTSSDTSWSGWYVVDTSATITGQVTLAGDVHLILKDGCGLQVDHGITGNYNLTIYQGTGSGTGALIVAVTDSSKSGIQVKDFTMNGGTIKEASTTGTGDGINCEGSFTMNDGTITNATGNSGIRCKGNFTMKNGTVTVAGKDGIVCESAFDMQDGELTVNAKGDSEDDIAGISCSSSTFTMSGGTITATAENIGAGGAYGIGCNVFYMSGGTLTADSSTDAGISCGSQFDFDPTGIMNGKINATFKGYKAAVQLNFTELHDLSTADPYLVAKYSAKYTGDMTKIDDLADLKAAGSGPYFLSIDGTNALKQLSLSPKTTEPEPENPQSGSNNPATGIVSANAALPAVVVLTVLAVSLTALLVINRKKNC